MKDWISRIALATLKKVLKASWIVVDGSLDISMRFMRNVTSFSMISVTRKEGIPLKDKAEDLVIILIVALVEDVVIIDVEKGKYYIKTKR